MLFYNMRANNFNSNFFSAAILAPFIVVLSAISLSVVKRAVEYLAVLSKAPLSSFPIKELKPVVKNVYEFIDRVLGGGTLNPMQYFKILTHYQGAKMTINTTNILLMTIVLVGVCGVITYVEVQQQQSPKALKASNKHEKRN